MKKIKVGLLPLYIKLYDDAWPELRERLEAFYGETVDTLSGLGFEVCKTPFCRLEKEFENALRYFEAMRADCVVTLHLAYSPSLESAAPLSRTRLPIVVFDTTMTYDFSPAQNSGEILYNHGIHGVMDMCALLRQNGKKYCVCAGYYQDKATLAKLSGCVRAAAAAGGFDGMRTGAIGGDFDGMGDFRVTDDEMKSRFHVEIVRAEPDELAALKESVTAAELKSELSLNNGFAQSGTLDEKTHIASARSDLAVRKWIEKERLSAFTANFRGIGKDSGLDAMPFLEASKAMERGTGYAGEGDVLTASFVGALLKGFPDTTFVEIFCPDWKGGTLLLSHMGEINLRIAENKILSRVPFPFTDADDPAVVYACMRPGRAVYANLCREKDGFKLVLSGVLMQKGDTGNFAGSVRGWMKPDVPMPEFLEKLSALGATHHSALIYGADVKALAFFGELLDLPVEVI